MTAEPGIGLPPPSDRKRPRGPYQVPGASSFRVAVTRPKAGRTESEDRLVRLLREAGMRPLAFPLLRILPPVDPGVLEAEVRAFLGGGGRAAPEAAAAPERWIVLTSRNALPPLLAAVDAVAGGSNPLEESIIRIAAVGKGTARAIEEVGLAVDLVPDRYRGEALLEALLRIRAGGHDRGVGGSVAGALEGVEILFPRGEEGNDALPRGLEEAGAKLRLVTAYRTEPDREVARRLVSEVAAGCVDVVTLTAGSAARVLAEALGAAGDPGWPPGTKIASVGPVTERAAVERGLPVHIIAGEATFESLVEAIARARPEPT